MGLVYVTEHQAGTGMVYHRHEAAYMTVVVDGCYTEVVEDKPRTYRRGAVVLHRPGEEHADHFISGTRCLNMHLAVSEQPQPAPVGRFNDGAQDAVHILEAFEKSGEEQLVPVFERLRVAFEQPSSINKHPRWLQSALTLEEWIDAVPLHDLAERCGVHPTHFSREFRRHTGVSPSEYRRRKRVALASKLLLNTDRTLARVALACGFTDQSHLNRAFALELGMAPAQYRRAFTR